MSRRRAGNGEGSLYQRGDGKWVGALTYTADGRARRHVVYGRTRADVRGKVAAVRARLDAGAPVRDARATLAAVAERWIGTSLAASDRKETTRANYTTIARTHVVGDPIGTVPLDRLRPTDVEALLARKRDAGLSASTRRTIYTVLRAVLDCAVRDGLVARNVAAAVKRPTLDRREARYLSADEVRALLGAADGDRLVPLFLLLLGTGLRRGEGLALRWADVDLDHGHARVRGTLSRVAGGLLVTEPKTERSRRAVPLPDPVVAVLRQHRARQAEERLRAGTAWVDSGLVFTSEVGTPLDPRNALRSLTSAARRAGLSEVGLHTLRHTAASALIRSDVHMRVVQELLGHSSYAITADIYAHVAPDQQRDAAERLAASYGW